MCRNIFFLASLTNCLDGWAARKFKCVSSWGVFYDPFADKILVLGTFFLLFWFSHVSVSWIFYVLLVARDLITTFLRWNSFDKGKIKMETSYLAKFKTVVQFISLNLLFIMLWMEKEYEISYSFWISPLLVYCCTFFSYISLIGYFKYRMRK